MKKEGRGSGGTEGRRKCLLINVGFEALLLLGSLHGGGSRGGGGRLLVFLKAQEAGVGERVEAKRGEEATRAATQLSNISHQTESRHLRHSSETAGRTGYHFTLFHLDYSHLFILVRGFFLFCFVLFCSSYLLYHFTAR